MNIKKSLIITVAVIGLASGLSINAMNRCQKGQSSGCKNQGRTHHGHHERPNATRVNATQVSVNGQIYNKTSEQCQWHMHGGQGHQHGHGHGHSHHSHGNGVEAKYVWNGETKQEGVIRVREANDQCVLYRK